MYVFPAFTFSLNVSACRACRPR
uniref:Uncharacterized protein n=1 Tax=Arundo donax TaxID=35708 RepID=A0A0A9AAW3_ARUDO